MGNEIRQIHKKFKKVSFFLKSQATNKFQYLNFFFLIFLFLNVFPFQYSDVENDENRNGCFG